MPDTERPIDETAAEPSLLAGAVQLTIRAEVNGQRYVGHDFVPVQVWQAYGEDFQEHLKEVLRQKLGRQIVADLDPEVTVAMPKEA